MTLRTFIHAKNGLMMQTLTRPTDHAVRLLAHHIHATGHDDDPWKALTRAERVNATGPLPSDAEWLTDALLSIGGDHIPQEWRDALATRPDIARPLIIDAAKTLIPHVDVPADSPIPHDTAAEWQAPVDAARWMP